MHPTRDFQWTESGRGDTLPASATNKKAGVLSSTLSTTALATEGHSLAAPAHRKPSSCHLAPLVACPPAARAAETLFTLPSLHLLPFSDSKFSFPLSKIHSSHR